MDFSCAFLYERLGTPNELPPAPRPQRPSPMAGTTSSCAPARTGGRSWDGRSGLPWTLRSRLLAVGSRLRTAARVGHSSGKLVSAS
jgi:hypothetical protein